MAPGNYVFRLYPFAIDFIVFEHQGLNGRKLLKNFSHLRIGASPQCASSKAANYCA